MAGGSRTLQGVREVSARGDTLRSSGGGEIASRLESCLHDAAAGHHAATGYSPNGPWVTNAGLRRNAAVAEEQVSRRYGSPDSDEVADRLNRAEVDNV